MKETARERSEYLHNPYTSSLRAGRLGRSPLRTRSGRRGRDPSLEGPTIGVTRSQYFTFQPSEPLVPLDTSKDREIISEVDSDLIDRRRANRSLKVQSLLMAQPWRRKTVHSSQPYLPVSRYHEERAGGARRKVSAGGGDSFSGMRPRYYQPSGPGYYRRSLEKLDREVEDEGRRRKLAAGVQENLSGAAVLSKYYRQPKYVKSKSDLLKRF